MLEGGGEVGKKLDFLLQEMNRETNTILSKTSGAGEAGLKITELALAAIEAANEAEIDAAMNAANAAPFPDVSELKRDVFAEEIA